MGDRIFCLSIYACQPLPEELWGKWRSAPPTSMLFEYRRDKTVYLIDGTRHIWYIAIRSKVMYYNFLMVWED